MIKTLTNFCFCCFFVLTSSFSAVSQGAQAMPKSTITRATGGSIQTPLGLNTILNEGSSLLREWITIHDPTLPVNFVGTAGVKTIYDTRFGRDDYRYTTNFTIEIKEQIVAVDVHFLLFDIWGNHTETLSLTHIQDMQNGKELDGIWRVDTENDVEKFYASIAYVSRIRTQSGRVIEANTTSVLEEARKFSKKFTVELLEPKSVKKLN